MTPPPDLVDKDALIATLMAWIEVLAARFKADLKKEVNGVSMS